MGFFVFGMMIRFENKIEVINMKVEYKSMFIGIVLGAISVSEILFLLGDVKTEFSFSTGDKNQDKNIEVSIERTIDNGEDITNVVIKGEGDVTREELDEAANKVFEMASSGKVKVKISKKYSLKDIAQAHKDLESRFLTGPAVILP